MKRASRESGEVLDRRVDVDRLVDRAAVPSGPAAGRPPDPDGQRSSISVTAPFTGQQLGTVPAGTARDVHRAVERARSAQSAWAARPMADRVAALDRFAQLVRRTRTELLDLVQLETGKAREHALAEWTDVIATAGYYADNAGRITASERRSGAFPFVTETTVHHDPIGVVGVIAPWNYPLTLAISDALPALAAGNAVVLKPAEQTPFTALRLGELAEKAGVPADVLSIVPGTGETAGAALTERADYLSFTGSTPVGRTIAGRAGERLVGASLELGGKGPAVVGPDVDIETAVRGAVSGAFDNAGQLCIATQRLYVHESIFESFRDRFLTAVESLSVGPGFDFETDVGAVISEPQLQRVESHVEQSVAAGATLLAGGRRRRDLGPLFYEPTVLTDVPTDAPIACEETFGPVASLVPVESVDEAVARANDTPYGLHGAVYTGDSGRGEAIARRLDTGTVTVNDSYAAAWLSTDAPMGGRKDSGLGRRHGPEGIRRYTSAQTVATQRTGPLGRPDWLPGWVFADALSGVVRLRRWLQRVRR